MTLVRHAGRERQPLPGGAEHRELAQQLRDRGLALDRGGQLLVGLKGVLRRRRLGEFQRGLALGVAQRRVGAEPEQGRSAVGLTVAGGPVQRGLAVLVLCVDGRAVGAEQLDEARVTLGGRAVQRDGAELVSVRHVGPVLEQRDRRVGRPVVCRPFERRVAIEGFLSSARSLGFRPPASSAASISAQFLSHPSVPSVGRPPRSLPVGRSERLGGMAGRPPVGGPA